jgi:hypothetical protein
VKIVMKHISGTAQDNRERAKEEMIRVLGFRGDIVKVNVKSSNIIIEITVNPSWEADNKIGYLKEWIPAKVKKVFEVVSISD